VWQGDIRNGTIVNAWTAGPTEAEAIVNLGGCTGTVVHPSWVLTAKHCGFGAGVTARSIRSSSTVTQTVDAVINATDPADFTMLHLAAPFTDLPQVPLYSGTIASLFGTTVSAYGYGAKASGAACMTNADCAAGDFCQGICMTPSAELRVGTLTPSSDSRYGVETYLVPMNSAGQVVLPGDSGGPSMSGGAITGVHSTSGVDMGIVSYRDWIATPSRVAYVSGDFNGDGKTDLIITTPNGSWWYYSNGDGTWNNAYTRTDLTLGNVAYSPGDFDGDGKTDLIIGTASGSWWYYSTGTGTWDIEGVNTTPTFQMGRRKITVGDFDGDGKDDFIVTATVDTPSPGSFWYYSTGRNSWYQAYARSDLPWGVADFVVGDFNGDGRKDVVISTPNGSWWYYSTSTRGVFNNAYTRDDLKRGAVEFTPADLNGDGKTDLVITNNAGSWWYYSTGTGTWSNPPPWTDAQFGLVTFFPGDFDGDGKADLIATMPGAVYTFSGSNGSGIVGTLYGQGRGTTLYTVGDFDGDGIADKIITTSSGSYWYYSSGPTNTRPDLSL
jgi:hypothetical protein